MQSGGERWTRGARWRALLVMAVMGLAVVLAACGKGEDRPGTVSVDPESQTTSVSGTGTGTGTHTGSASGTHTGSATGTATAAEPGRVQPKPEGAAQVNVTLREWAIDVSPARVKAGKVYFLVENKGPEDPHEMVIVRTDRPAGQLPVVNGIVPEDRVEIVGEVEAFAPGTKASGVFDLEPGRYVLICNIAEREQGKLESHYQEGMYTTLTVEP